MKKWLPHLFVSCTLLFIGIWYLQSIKTTPAITYFQKDETNYFTNADTSLAITSAKDTPYRVRWQTSSTTNEPAYLRQDISFLFANGELSGVRTSWKQHVRKMNNILSMPGYENTLWQSISLHHAEMHEKKNQITGIQQSTADNIYVYKNTHQVYSFRQPAKKEEKDIQNKLNLLTKNKLTKHWSNMAKQFNLQLSDYIVFGLTDLHQYDKKPLPRMNQTQTDEVIGKLWEGIYKNYLLPAAQYGQNKLTSMMPCILVDMKNREIIVLFDLNGKAHQLIQKLPKNNERFSAS